MAQFDVFQTAFPNAPLVLDVQSDLLNNLDTRVVIPLEPITIAAPLVTRLNPAFDIRGASYFLDTAEISTVPAAALKLPVASLALTHRQAIIDALDFLVHGY